jgi:hypothetical protein
MVVPTGGSGYTLDSGTPVRRMLRDLGDLTGGVFPSLYSNEEQVCWGCHVDGMDYYGDNSVTTDVIDWRGNWDKSIAIYKDGDFMSSHFYPSLTNTWTGGVPGGTRNPDVFCSTCHSVHGIIAADQENGGDLAYMGPILRGTWLTSPYKEDRAPGTVTGTYTVGPDDYGPFPRVVPDKYQGDVASGAGYTTDAYVSGFDGYFIDQNTFGVGTYIGQVESEFAGLCMACHTQADLTTPTMTWTGHNTVKGWDGLAATDIFKGDLGARTGTGEELTNSGGSEWMQQWFGGDIGDYSHPTGGQFWGTRTSELKNDPPGWRTPEIDSRLVAVSGYPNPWNLNYTIQSAGNIETGYHKYPCSKCHTPHAARLPRLMRSNCLDNGSYAGNVNESTTDYFNVYTSQGGGLTNPHTTDATVLAEVFSVQAGESGPNTMNFEAANCHSVAGSTSGGWNTLTPW